MTAITLKTIAVLQTHTALRATAARRRRPLGQRLELAAVLSLLGSSAAYAVFALAHLS